MNLDQLLRLQQVMNEIAVNLPEYAALSAAHHPYTFEIMPGFHKAEVVIDAVGNRQALVEAGLVPAAETR